MTHCSLPLADQAVCTIVTAAYLPQARVLASALHQHHPDLPLYVLLADRSDQLAPTPRESFTVVRLEDLPARRRIAEMTFYYNASEFCSGLRPLLHQWMMQHTPHAAWIYLDADILICDRLDPLLAALQAADIVLTPHMRQAVPDEQVELEISVVRRGVYNGGTLALRRTPEVERFLCWFGQRATRYAFNDHMGLFTDQLWLNLVPLLFRNVAICDHPGINVGYWNLHERPLSWSEHRRPLAGGQPLCYLHFSGWDMNCPRRISRWAAESTAVPPVWEALALQYRQALLDAGIAQWSTVPYGFARFDDGQLIEPWMRWMYFDDLQHGRANDGVSPFAQSEKFKARGTAERETRRRTAQRGGSWWRQWHHRFPGWRWRESLMQTWGQRQQPPSAREDP